MRVAALYDVHAMPWALEAVLADLHDGVDKIVFGGDFIGGPYPRREATASATYGSDREMPDA